MWVVFQLARLRIELALRMFSWHSLAHCKNSCGVRVSLVVLRWSSVGVRVVVRFGESVLCFRFLRGWKMLAPDLADSNCVNPVGLTG